MWPGESAEEMSNHFDQLLERVLRTARIGDFAPGGGAQIELPPRIRGLGPFWEGYAGTCPHTEDLIDALAVVARSDHRRIDRPNGPAQ